MIIEISHLNGKAKKIEVGDNFILVCSDGVRFGYYINGQDKILLSLVIWNIKHVRCADALLRSYYNALGQCLDQLAKVVNTKGSQWIRFRAFLKNSGDRNFRITVKNGDKRGELLGPEYLLVFPKVTGRFSCQSNHIFKGSRKSPCDDLSLLVVGLMFGEIVEAVCREILSIGWDNKELRLKFFNLIEEFKGKPSRELKVLSASR